VVSWIKASIAQHGFWRHWIARLSLHTYQPVTHVRLGITANTSKDALWKPVAETLLLLRSLEQDTVLHPDIHDGLVQRKILVDLPARVKDETAFLESSDVVLSLGGDGTLLGTARMVGERNIPILGVNYGRLGFLANVEAADLPDAIGKLNAGQYDIENRLVLDMHIHSGQDVITHRALNDCSLQRSGDPGLLSLDVFVDGCLLNTYWGDGIILSTPTGSTAYSLALGGPIMAPGCGGILITPVAPHTLTVRPMVLPEHVRIEVRISADNPDCSITADGQANLYGHQNIRVCVSKAGTGIQLLQLHGSDYFTTLRSKLMWGARKLKGA